MTASVNILRGDLHLAVSTAFNRGRYVLMTGGGDGAPIEITIDLRERPDDLFAAEDACPAAYHPENLQRGAFDDHGPAIPAQSVRQNPQPPTGPIVYEFALQDLNGEPDAPFPMTLDQVEMRPGKIWAPYEICKAAAAADWVHVYDRVTRERRTLKRPASDAVLTGLRDVAADLRGKTYPEKAAEHLQALERGSPVEPPFGCAALPPVGPLTSTEGLRAGDVLRVIETDPGYLTEGHIVRVIAAHGPGNVEVDARPCVHFLTSRFAFVGRPDADGWIPWAGGENPVPGARVAYRMLAPHVYEDDADRLRWHHESNAGDITAFRIVDAPGK